MLATSHIQQTKLHQHGEDRIPSVFSYGCQRQWNWQWQKKSGELLAVLIAMVMQRYNAMYIARWSISEATLEATGCHHPPSGECMCRIAPAAAMVDDFVVKHKNTNKVQIITSCLRELIPQNGPSTQLIDVTSCIKMRDISKTRAEELTDKI